MIAFGPCQQPELQGGLLRSMISINEVRLMKGRSSPNRGAILKFTGRNKESSEKPGRTITTQARIRTQHFPNTSHRRIIFNLMMLRKKKERIIWAIHVTRTGEMNFHKELRLESLKGRD
jgi:hypothetical protein